jgi:hypothetical protein
VSAWNSGAENNRPSPHPATDNLLSLTSQSFLRIHKERKFSIRPISLSAAKLLRERELRAQPAKISLAFFAAVELSFARLGDPSKLFNIGADTVSKIKTEKIANSPVANSTELTSELFAISS